MSDNEGELGAWQREVENFGGRVGAGDQKTLWKELQESQLGSTKVLKTSEANPNFPAVVVLAEMKLTRPIAVDVSFSYLGLVKQGLIVTPPPAPSGLNQGAGYVQVTWGTPGAIQQSAKIDGGRGWRFPFVASFLRVEYIPIDRESPAQWFMQGGQPSDLTIQAMIAPASGAPCLPLTKTVYFADVPISTDPLPFSFGSLPAWAVRAHFNAFVQRTDEFSVFFSQADNAEALGVKYANGLAGEWPNYTPQMYPMVLPQTARIAVIIANSTVSLIQNPTMVCELAL